MPRTILITGANGEIGHGLVTRLAETEPARIVALDLHAPDAAILEAIGKWTHAYGESIYGCGLTPLAIQPWGVSTYKAADHALYLHVFEWPADGKLHVPGLKNRVERAYLLADRRRKPLGTETNGTALTLSVPVMAPDAVSTTIALRIEGAPDVEPAP